MAPHQVDERLPFSLFFGHRFLDAFCSFCGSVLAPFGLHFGRLWSILATFWLHVGRRGHPFGSILQHVGHTLAYFCAGAPFGVSLARFGSLLGAIVQIFSRF